MALPRKLQIQGPCLNRLQQPPTIHKHKEFEYEVGLMSLRTLLILFPNRLSQGKANAVADVLSRFL